MKWSFETYPGLISARSEQTYSQTEWYPEMTDNQKLKIMFRLNTIYTTRLIWRDTSNR